MKKIIVLPFLLLSWFICMGQQELISLSLPNEPLIEFDYEGTFLYESPLTQFTCAEEYAQAITVCQNDIYHNDKRVEITNGNSTVALVYSEDCRFIRQYVLYVDGLIIDFYTFKNQFNRY